MRVKSTGSAHSRSKSPAHVRDPAFIGRTLDSNSGTDYTHTIQNKSVARALQNSGLDQSLRLKIADSRMT